MSADTEISMRSDATSFLTRSLAVKLTAAFVFVGLTGIGILLLVGVQTQREFDQFMVVRYRTDLANLLEENYQANGGWGEMSRLLEERPAPPEPDPKEPVAVVIGTVNGDRRKVYVNAPVTVVDGDRHVVYSRVYAPGEQLPAALVASGIALTADDQAVGWLLFDAPVVRQPASNSPEANFIQRVGRVIFFYAIAGALGLAILLGGVLARQLTRPVRDLMAATRAISRGDLGHQVVVRTNDELGQLGEAFNHMSADLARSVHLRRQMTADIAHDLRTPLSVILGYTEALADGKLNATPQTYAVLHDEAQHLRRLIDDLRVLSLADAGELTLQRAAVSPAELLGRVALAQQVQADQKGVKLVVEADETLPFVEADPERIAQVFGNLLSNALRYTPVGGEIRLTATAEDGQIVMQVRDTGMGIAPEDQPNIFERFYRADKARSQNGESGLGLAIAKSVVEMHGGAISVTSVPGQGSIFTVLLPVARAA